MECCTSLKERDLLLAVVYNHSSAPGILSSAAFEALGPVLAGRG